MAPWIQNINIKCLLAAAHGSAKRQHLPFGYFYLGKGEVMVLRARNPEQQQRHFPGNMLERWSLKLFQASWNWGWGLYTFETYFYFIYVYMYAGVCVSKKGVRSLGAGVPRKSPNRGDGNQMQTSGRSESKHTLSQIYRPLAIFNNTSQKSVRQSLKTNTHT